MLHNPKRETWLFESFKLFHSSVCKTWMLNSATAGSSKLCRPLYSGPLLVLVPISTQWGWPHGLHRRSQSENIWTAPVPLIRTLSIALLRCCCTEMLERWWTDGMRTFHATVSHAFMLLLLFRGSNSKRLHSSFSLTIQKHIPYPDYDTCSLDLRPFALLCVDTQTVTSAGAPMNCGFQ